MMESIFPQGPLSPRVLLRALPLIFIIAAALTIVFMIARQLGLDSRTIEVVDMRTGETRSFRIVTVLPRDAIPAITDPSFVSVTEAARWMDAREQVIGLEIGGEAKAYPINVLSRHEIVDDVVGGKPVAITW